MKTINYEQLIALHPCWLRRPGRMQQLQEYAAQKSEWSALDILRLPDAEVSVENKLWVVLRPELIDDSTLHEFACRCAERALSLVGNPDPRSVAAIEAKRKWLRGEITNAELATARSDAWNVARSVAWTASRVAAWTASRSAAWKAAWTASRSAAWNAAQEAAWSAAPAAERQAQVDLLVEMLEEA